MDKREIETTVLENASFFEKMSDTIWDYAEIRFQEHRSAKLQKEFLEQEGFRIKAPIGLLETAFIAEYGHGKPVIAILGEFDALHGLSQVAGSTEKKELIPSGNGHGCGHHLLGTAAVEAVFAVRQWMKKNKVDGTIRYYGCPAEEQGAGKVHMIRAGTFTDVDVALSWHPQQTSFLIDTSPAAVSVVYSFHGKAAHAATNPHLGRSALDAAELMNIGINYLREHLPPGATVQYAFINAGGSATNIVPDYASAEYTVRALSKQDMDEVFQRISEMASGAALMTGTRAERSEITMAYSDVVNNYTLLEIVQQNGAAFSATYSEEDYRQAQRFSGREDNTALNTGAFYYGKMRGSTDFGDVTHVVPGAAFTMTTFAAGTALHSWSATAQGKLGYAHKGMHRAAMILAGTAADLFSSPESVIKARNEFQKKTAGSTYESLLPPLK